VSDEPDQGPESAEHRADLTGLTRLSDRPPPPKGERAIRVVRGLSILLLAIAAAGLPWYLVTRGGSEKPGAKRSPTPTVSPSPSPSPSLVAGNYEVTGVDKCLHIRKQPSTQAPVIDCLTKGFPVRSDGKTQTADGRLWRHVYDKLKKSWGWAADQYLKKV